MRSRADDSLSDTPQPSAGRSFFETLKRVSPILLPLLLAAAVLIPGSNLPLFSGLPLANVPEAVVLALVAPLLVSRSLRSLQIRVLRRLHERLPSALAVAMLVAIAMKVVLLASGVGHGFAACYRGVEDQPSDCRASYEDPFRRSGATRFDRAIDFRARDRDAPSPALQRSNWELSLFNDLRYNLYTGDEPASRARLPFAASWQATVAPASGVPVQAFYVGEGRIRLGQREVTLPPSYDRLSVATLAAVNVEPQDVELEYAFDPPAGPGGDEQQPYATLRLLAGDKPLRPMSPGVGWWILARTADAILVISGVLIALALARSLRGIAWMVGAAAGIGALALLLGYADSVWVLPAVSVALGMILAFGFHRRSVAEVGVIALLSFAALSLAHGFGAYAGTSEVVYRQAGDDFLTYESHARDVLETWTLRGGEDVYVYSPGFRYIVFGGHLLFGDGDMLPSVTAITMLGFSSLLLVRTSVWGFGSAQEGVADRRRKRTRTQDWFGLPGFSGWRRLLRTDRTAAVTLPLLALLLLVFVNSPLLVSMVRTLMSEHATWITVLLAVPMLLFSRRPAHWLLGTAMVGLAFVVRANQAPGLALLFAAFLVRLAASGDLGREMAAVRRRRWALGCALLLAGVGLLPAVHNLYYGGEFAVLPRTPDLPVNFPIPLSDVPAIFSDSAVWATFLEQLRGVTFSYPWEGDTRFILIGLFLRVVQGAWLASIGYTFVRWRTLGWQARIAVWAPAAFLVPHLFIQVSSYYPRHIIMGHLAMIVAAMVVVSTSSSAMQGTRHEAAGW